MCWRPKCISVLIKVSAQKLVRPIVNGVNLQPKWRLTWASKIKTNADESLLKHRRPQETVSRTESKLAGVEMKITRMRHRSRRLPEHPQLTNTTIFQVRLQKMFFLEGADPQTER